MDAQTVDRDEWLEPHEGLGDPHARPVVYVAVVGIIALLVAVFGLEGLYYQNEQREARIKLATPEQVDLLRLRTEQRHNLSGYQWVDREKGIVTIPIEQAMERVARQYAAPGPAPQSPGR